MGYRSPGKRREKLPFSRKRKGEYFSANVPWWALRVRLSAPAGLHLPLILIKAAVTGKSMTYRVPSSWILDRMGVSGRMAIVSAIPANTAARATFFSVSGSRVAVAGGREHGTEAGRSSAGRIDGMTDEGYRTGHPPRQPDRAAWPYREAWVFSL